MPARLGSLLGGVLVACAVVALRSQSAAPEPQADSPLVYSAELESIIHPVSAEFMIETMDRADRDNAAVVVFTLRTPGGLLESTRDIVTRMLAASTPVVIFVGPSGARAASAGFILTIAADVAAMAPGTHVGAAHPVSGNGAPVDEVMSKKAAEDVAAYVRTIAAGRRRNVPLAEQAVNDSRAFTETEALTASPPLVDLVAADVPDLLAQLEGRAIRRFDGRTAVLRTRGARVVALEMSLRQRVLSSIAHPNIAYLLLSLGMLGLTIELWSPGAILPGVVGGVSLLLAFFALQLLPVNYAGLLLILLGLLLFALEIKVTSYGGLTVGGLVSLVFGSLMLIDSSSAPGLRVSVRLVVAVVLGFSAIGITLARIGLAAQRQPAVTGEIGMIDESGQALTAIEPGGLGRVFIHGEHWQATAAEPIAEGTRVRVAGVSGLLLTVRKE
jgi:membrane-bound serine protease (ClpP class)